MFVFEVTLEQTQNMTKSKDHKKGLDIYVQKN